MDLRSWFSRIDWKTVFLVFLIFVLAFGVRAFLLKYELMFEFDTYWHARMTGEVIQNGAPPAVDPLAYYQLENGSPIPKTTQFFWYVSAAIYSIVALVTTGSMAYNKELLIELVKLLPALYGALVCVGLYFLGKEAYGKRAGLLMAFFGAVSASFVYRSLAGFYEAGTFAYILFIFGFYFVLRAVKRKEDTRSAVLNGVAAAALLGLLSSTYGLFMIIPIVLLFYAVMMGIELASRHRFSELKRFLMVVIGILVGFVLVSLTGPNGQWVSDMIGLITGATDKAGFIAPAAAVLGIGIVGAIIFWVVTRPKGVEAEKKPSALLKQLKLGVLYVVLLAVLVLMFTPKQVTDVISASVGEESAGYLYFFHKFGVLIVFPILALLLAPIIEHKKKEVDWAGMLLFPFILVSFFIAWDRLHYSFNLGVPLAIAAGYLVHYTLQAWSKRATSERAAVGVLLGFMVLAGAASATIFTQNNTPTIEQNTGWKEGLRWLGQNSPADSKVFNWWDEGHWITFLAERKAITDNRNYSREANSDVGKFVITTEVAEAKRILQKYDSDFIVLGADLFTKRNSMVLYAFYSDQPFNGSDPRLDPVQSFYLPCSRVEQTGGIVYQCGGNSIPEVQMNSVPTQWTGVPASLENGRDPIFLYTTPDKTMLYRLSLKQNQTVFAKIWFGAPEVKNWAQEVYPLGVVGASNKEFKVFKVNKQQLLSS